MPRNPASRAVGHVLSGRFPEYDSTAKEGRAVSTFRAGKRANRRFVSLFVRSLAVGIGLLGISLGGCGGGTSEPVEYPPPPPVVEESYEVDDANRPLTEEELDAAFARLTSDPAAFVAELEKAPPVRQASLIYVLQRDAEAARENRALLEKLSTSSHGIVRRAALFAQESVEEEEASAKE